jgi:predicted nucleic acid-binding protein
VIYADTSAFGRVYFADEDDHQPLRSLLVEGDEQVVSSQLARLELASAATRAQRAGRVGEAGG